MTSSTFPYDDDHLTEGSQSWLIKPIFALMQLNMFDNDALKLIAFDDGLCHGFAYEAMLSALSGKRDTFISHIDLIKETPPVKLAALIKLSQLINIDHKQTPSKRKRRVDINDADKMIGDHFALFILVGKMTRLDLYELIQTLNDNSQMRETWMEIYGLFQRVLITHSGNRHELSIQDPYINEIAFGNNIDNMLNLVKPKGSPNIINSAKFSNAYTEVLFVDLFSCFHQAIKNEMVNQVSFVLTNRNHTITICYSSKERKKWLFINANIFTKKEIEKWLFVNATIFTEVAGNNPYYKPYYKTNNVNELASLVVLAFEEKRSYSICTIKTYINQPDKTIMKTIWEKLNKLKKWQNVMEITPVQASIVDHEGGYLLIIATNNGEIENLPYIIEHTENPNALYQNCTPLICAISGLYHETVKVLLENEKVECTPKTLTIGLSTRDEKIIHMILDRLFLDISNINEIYDTLVTSSSLYQSYLFKVIRSHPKFDINHVFNDQHQTLLTFNAIRASNISLKLNEIKEARLIIKLCLSDEKLDSHSDGTKTSIIRIAKINQHDIQEGLFNRYLIAIKNNDEEMKKFLDETLSIDFQSAIIEERFHQAIKENNINELSLLLALGAAKYVNHYYQHSSLTPLFIAIWNHYSLNNSHFPIVEALLKNNANPNQITADSTALHVAVFQSNLQIIQLLLSYGADINGKDNVGATPLCTAVKLNDTNIAEYLIDHGANIHCDINGENIADLALKNHHADMLLFLLKKDIKLSNNIENKTTHYNKQSPLLFKASETSEEKNDDKENKKNPTPLRKTKDN